MNVVPLSISSLINEIKLELESNFRDVIVEGEISNLSLSSSGHWYLTLSDKDASVSAAVFKLDALRNPVINKLKSGDKIVAQGEINVYPKRGTFQVIIKRIVPKGLGDLKEQFEKLKKRLAEEGLFDLSTKKKIPELPKRIAVITALRGAALQDFLNIYQRRSLWMDVVIIPTLVQGDESPKALRRSLFNVIKYSLNNSEEKKIDLILFTRGGGSMEDLWAFNDEGLAWDIYNCPIPVVSAVGHEVDFTICDFVADLRLETPSAAAEVLTQKQTLIKEKLLNSKNKLKNEMRYFYQHLTDSLGNKKPQMVLSILIQKISNYQKRIQRLNIANRFQELSHLYDYQIQLDDINNRISALFEKSIDKRNVRLQKVESLLVAYNPMNVLKRGYTYTESEGKVILDSDKFDQLDNSVDLKIHFVDGVRIVKKAEMP